MSKLEETINLLRNNQTKLLDCKELLAVLEDYKTLKGLDKQPEINVTETFNIGGVEFTMVKVNGGSFMMGCDDKESYSDEQPANKVTLDSYYIGSTPVTQVLWKSVMGNNPSYFKGEKLPVEQVSWKDCQEFIKKLNQLTGKQFKLPTEAEWEFAARGGNCSNGYKYAGSNNLEEVGWYWGNCNSQTYPVGEFKPNELGLYDMSGNVYEWCQDWYGGYRVESQSNPTGSATGSCRVIRGGSWRTSAGGCRVSDRHFHVPTYRNDFIGFRLALQ